MIAAIRKGYIHDMLMEESNKKFREVDTNERLIVGVNHLAIPESEDFEIPIKEVHADDCEKIAKRMEDWKKTRDMPAVTDRLGQLYADAKKGDRFNLMPAIIEAVKVYATAGEISGVIRLARGLSYDPLNVIMPMPTRPLVGYQDFLRHVLVDDLDGVKIITLRRPEALNALHDDMTDEILSVIHEYENSDSVRGFVIVGYGDRAFCAGADIGKFPSMLGNLDGSIQASHDWSRLLVHLDKMSKPVIAALNGMTLGGGLELAMRCHGIVALRNVWMQLPEITLGIVPGIGALVVPYRRWPKAAAVFHGMLRQADRLKATHAHELGMVDALANDYRGLILAAIERVTALSGKVTQITDGPVSVPELDSIEPKASNGQPLSSEVIGIMEAAIRDGAAASTFAEALEISYRAFGRSACTAAAKEGISAFQEGRKPDFTKTP